MIQTQFAHTINVPDEWEHDGHTFQVMQDIDAECPTEWYDTVEMITLDTYSRTTIPTYAPSDGAEWDVLDIMRNQFSHDSDLTTEAWENACKACGIDNPNVRIDRAGSSRELVAIVGGPEDYLESFVHVYNEWADGNVWVVSDTTTGDSLASIYADSEEDAIRHYINEYK
jgi:hypothetical protein